MVVVRRLARSVLSWRGLLVLVVAAGLFIWYSWPDNKDLERWVHHYDTDAVPADLVPPGTVIGTTAPPGWSRLVVKSLPRVAPEERHKVSSLIARKAEQQFATMLADVGPAEGNPARHRLRAVAVGMGRRVKDQDMILSPDTAKQFDAELDLIDRQVLETSFERQKGARVLVRSEVFALIDAPVPFACGPRNKMVAFRYALLVDEPTGRLDVLNWWVDNDTERRCARDPALPEMVWLPPDLLNEPFLYVDDKELRLFGSLPTPIALGVNRLPAKGVSVVVPPELWTRADLPGFKDRADDARHLEAELRKLIDACLE